MIRLLGDKDADGDDNHDGDYQTGEDEDFVFDNDGASEIRHSQQKEQGLNSSLKLLSKILPKQNCICIWFECAQAKN